MSLIIVFIICFVVFCLWVVFDVVFSWLKLMSETIKFQGELISKLSEIVLNESEVK